MDINKPVNWIGTPKAYIYKDDITYDAVAIDFAVEQDDARYKLIILKHHNDMQYKIIKYGVKPGAQKPFPIDTGQHYKNETNPLIESILQDPYVQMVLQQKSTS
ncbi:DUF3910 family protein [Bacillus manliponensis]|uniref:DUF3910 family protein n=1 Tax=Bacillus manliponensis TaxID=574376 RepID=UPI003514C290